MRLRRLRGRKVADRVRNKGKRFKGKHMTVSYLPGIPRPVFLLKPTSLENNDMYVGTSASRKLHKSAVKRNTMRRRCREALRTSIHHPLSTAFQLLISPRSSSLTCDFTELQEDIEALLKHLSSSAH